jgi:hypothetical protein
LTGAGDFDLASGDSDQSALNSDWGPEIFDYVILIFSSIRLALILISKKKIYKFTDKLTEMKVDLT